MRSARLAGLACGEVFSKLLYWPSPSQEAMDRVSELEVTLLISGRGLGATNSLSL